jgi:hypothetical protein
MAEKEAIHPGDDGAPELHELLSVDGSLVAQTDDLVDTARELETHVRRDVVVWLIEIQRCRENSGGWVVRGSISGEKSVYWLGDPVQGIVETGSGGERLVEPGEKFVLDSLTEFHGECVVWR